LVMPRYNAALLIFAAVTISGAWNTGQQSAASVARMDGPVTGSAYTERLGTVQWSYHFDHNALKDAELVARSLVALTESGNLVCFNRETLSITAQQVVPGRGIAIARGDAGKLLIGAEDGQIYELTSETLALTPVTKASGRVLWLSTGKAIGKPRSIVAVIDARADVMPWPGEPFKAYETRSARIEQQAINPLKVLIFAGGTSKYIPFKQGSFATPNAFMLDDSDRLWMGADKGEWGGQYSYLELRTGNVHNFGTDSGVLGFLKVGDGRVLAYGGMSHMGMESGFVADVSKKPALYLREFTNRPKTELPEDTKRVLEQAKAGRPASLEGAPQGAIDLVIEDNVSGGFWVLSAHDVYRCDRDFAKWEKVANFGGRWSGGRNYSVGNTPTIRRVLATGADHPDLIAVSARDGLARFSNGKVQHVQAKGQIESSIIEVWPTSIGVLFLNDDESHTGWRLYDDEWQRLRFFPDEQPSDTYAAWNFGEPILDDHGIVAYFGTNVTPGERGFLKVGDQLKAAVLQTWVDKSSFYGSSILGTSDGTMLDVSEDGLRRWNGKEWESAGTYSGSDADRRRLLKARSYIPISDRGARGVFLDAELGDLLRLTKSEKGYDLRPLTTAKGPAPAGIFDAIADHDGYLLAATASGLVRFNPESGERQVIPAPNATEEFKTIARDSAGRIWTAGDLLYVSIDEGKHWSLVRMPMLSPTYIKRIREVSPGTLAIALHDRGVVFVNGPQK
jgi:ligand-binding sensor domain-containing protein